MRKVLLTILLLSLCSCASVRSSYVGPSQRIGLSKDLSEAKSLLEIGNRTEATRSLTSIIDSGNYSGITDEALFLLALLDLKPAQEHEANSRSLQLLKRLAKAYPASPFTAQSRQLLEFLGGVDEMRSQVRNLKGQNQSLSKEVDELNRNIDQLKKLDQELERKRR
jgi:cell division protein FtsB